MSFETEHQAAADLLAVYAVDAVDRAEAALVEQHLTECPRCRAEVDALREVAGALGTVNEQPPPALWDQIHGKLRTPDEPKTAPDMSVLPGEAGHVDDRPVDRRADETRARSHRRRRRATAAAVCAVAAAAIAVIVLLVSSLQTVDTRISKIENALGTHLLTNEVAAALVTPGRELIPLRTPDGDQVAEAVIVPGGRGFLLNDHLASLPSTKTYQLWVVTSAAAVSLGVLGAQPSTSSFTASGTGAHYALALTVEERGGAPQPTTRPVAQGRVGA
jgi:anti-sigma factor RsiW